MVVLKDGSLAAFLNNRLAVLIENGKKYKNNVNNNDENKMNEERMMEPIPFDKDLYAIVNLKLARCAEIMDLSS